MSDPRLLILADERLVGRGLASLLATRFEAHSVESVIRAVRLLDDSRREAALWVGERLDRRTVEGLADLKRAHPRLALCVLARTADPDALRELLLQDSNGVAVLLRRRELDVNELVA